MKKRVLRFLNQPEIKRLYHRVQKDSKNFGRVFVHFEAKQKAREKAEKAAAEAAKAEEADGATPKPTAEAGAADGGSA